MNKHLNSVPAVAVVFIDLEWDAAEWNERKMECSARVQAVRGNFFKIVQEIVPKIELEHFSESVHEIAHVIVHEIVTKIDPQYSTKLFLKLFQIVPEFVSEFVPEIVSEIV